MTGDVSSVAMFYIKDGSLLQDKWWTNLKLARANPIFERISTLSNMLIIVIRHHG